MLDTYDSTVLVSSTEYPIYDMNDHQEEVCNNEEG
jgi:hypothetical protein